MSDLAGARILVTGGTGFLGRHVCEALALEGARVFPVSRRVGYDLRNEAEAFSTVLAVKPDIIIHLAGHVGGIGANMAKPATFFRDNMAMGMNIVHVAAVAETKLVTVGTVCSYAKDTPIPFREEAFWEGYPEPTNAPYGIAKKALYVMCRAYQEQHGLRFTYLVPCNMYGPLDSFDDATSHVIPAMIKRFTEAREKELPEVSCWGTGNATRSFLYVADAAKGIVAACARKEYPEIVNLPGGPETSMRDLASLTARVCGYKGKVRWDPSKPDGQPRRAIDGSRAERFLEWRPETTLEEGLRVTHAWYQEAVSGAGVRA